MIQALLVAICLAVFPYQGSSIILESGNVNDYEVVYPQKVPALSKGGVQNPQPETKYEDTMQYEFHVNGEPVVLHLERNKGLFSEDYTETHYAPDGREITTSSPVQDHCYYHGYIQNEADSSAVISACDGLKGHFKHQGETYFIEPLELSDSEAHAIYKDENVEEEEEIPKICGVTQTTWESDEPIEKSSQLTNTPEQDRYLQAKKYIEFYVVVDNVMYRKYTGKLHVITRRVYEMVNALNTMYRRLNFHIALIGLEIWSNGNEINVQSDVQATLDLFGEWRENKLLPRKRNDNAQLLTSTEFNGTTTGLGYIGSLCSPKKSVAVVQDHSKSTSMVAITMAHQMGHNLGMNDDRASCTCGSNKCIMSTKYYESLSEFSSCSVQEHREYLLRDRPQCILNKPSRKAIVTPPVCGNYFVERGEECDCGSPEDCQNTCCDAATCKLQHEAQCDSGECCEKCKFKGAGAECRAAKNDCDFPELCTGRSAKCPKDSFQRNGHPCQNNQGYCYNGTCPTLTNQCATLWGPGAKMSPGLCFMLNWNARSCGLCRKENGRKILCAAKDVKCGRLFCKKKNSMICHCPPPSKDPNYGMVAPGTKCGVKKVCRNRQCVKV
uniref:Snake venom metalloproteinase-disintegrin-like mocarhagin n=1 Tax=Naja mossambica TaxID=8644 RepID=VM3M1_NAJMO|nr:RecName: Full=Snake venom metalloproteinase-disintegrin-like mocarhagin; Short=MOC; Short=Mocarhagin-1; Short=SVMP; AltName: Full=Zinc metalloproteinase mocarhagin; Flags: Precursor [Naja mossambica]AAM51550.1 mocarhagin 1 [Naja mossambica]